MLNDQKPSTKHYMNQSSNNPLALLMKRNESQVTCDSNRNGYGLVSRSKHQRMNESHANILSTSQDAGNNTKGGIPYYGLFDEENEDRNEIFSREVIPSFTKMFLLERGVHVRRSTIRSAANVMMLTNGPTKANSPSKLRKIDAFEQKQGKKHLNS